MVSWGARTTVLRAAQTTPNPQAVQTALQNPAQQTTPTAAQNPTQQETLPTQQTTQAAQQATLTAAQNPTQQETPPTLQTTQAAQQEAPPTLTAALPAPMAAQNPAQQTAQNPAAKTTPTAPNLAQTPNPDLILQVQLKQSYYAATFSGRAFCLSPDCLKTPKVGVAYVSWS